mmetsp:Transcript_46546/g.113369  ORF Transcript_46546/g.113369 Transcript_46546/m.113369 type:complete len:235 (-) Transcript_46546:1719-2423(-)
MAQALPLTKLASLLVKTLAKPLSKRIKHDFSRFDSTKRLLVWIGQTNHTVTSYMQIWSSGYRVRNIKPLESEKALKDGAEFVGESFIFSVSVGLLLWEYNRSAEISKQKSEKKRQEIKKEQARLQAKLHALDVRLKAVEDTVKEQTDSLLGITVPIVQPIGRRKKYQPPPEAELVDIDAPISSLDDDNDDDDEKKKNAIDIEKGLSQGSNNTQHQQPTSLVDNSTHDRPWWRFW